MNTEYVKNLLEDIKSGSLSIEGGLEKLKNLPYADLDFAKPDFHRGIRTGVPEVIYCERKALPHIKTIVETMLQNGQENILATRTSKEAFAAIKEAAPDAVYYELPRLAVIERKPLQKKGTAIAVCTGGTADIYAAEEAAITAELFGNTVVRLYDVGVAGLHRLLDKLKVIQSASVIIAAAGMEGALPSVIAGLVSKPVIALPTSVGYGASFNGLAALLAMLNSCASGVSVVNIDNGFGAGYLASMINR